ncbi:hypothetical protein C7399_109207 [Paraburkholderia tropica]|uniref:Uncharacterized protein n=1 Tax=Paraburkholderia tropica TaxID=92647 RepID=A0ABX5MP10_9BURK|nr:hypothetical protein C7400_109207 [Paraburkholderia tropica]PZW82131.1 hypothetical protein C7399_109207 [Paraburkholderia tropica]
MPTVQVRARAVRVFTRPRLHTWSIAQADPAQVAGEARADYERELRISALGSLIEASCATRLWRRVCCYEMTQEIRRRSPGRRLAMELALQESMR